VNISYTLSLPTEAESVPTARLICRANLELLQVARESIDDVTLALTEACANVVKHAGGHRYQVRVSIEDDRCRIDVLDEGGGFDPGAIAESDPEALLPSGRGLMLIESVVDKLAFTKLDGVAGTVLSLEKRLALDPGSPLAVSSVT
jgi:anti-sigma regulatory factor (Ser/Thr protein kinase)